MSPLCLLPGLALSRSRTHFAVALPLRLRYAINYGIKTGYNEAFIIDNRTKEALITQDPRSEEIIKPVLRGRDIERYQAKWADMWLIDTHNGYDGIPPIEIDSYPAIKAYLDGYYEQLEKRFDKGRTPYNLRNCAYHADFSKEKLLWIELVNHGRFAYDNSGLYGEATTFLLTGGPIKYLCALLNAKLIRWCLENMAPTSGMGTLRWKKVYVERLPIPRISGSNQRPYDQMIDRVLRMLAHDPNSNRLDAEAEIDQMVYQLYGLTASEIAVVEQRT